MTRPPIITAAHVALLAIGYGRQSTKAQFENNTGSTDYQRAQLRFPREWGWPESLIQWLDDFGLSGTAPDHRPGYLELRRLVGLGKVGLVCVSEINRLGRNAAELLSFLSDCSAHRVLLAVDGKVLDPRDPSDWLLNALQAVLGEHGGNNIRDTLQHGRMAKLESGVAVSYPPVGYDQGAGKEWTVTSDASVRTAIAKVFRVFFEARTLRATVVRLRQLGVKIPRRKPGRPIHWREATINVLQDILDNPNYMPHYHYRRRVDDHTKGRSAKGRRRVRKAKPEEVKIIRDHHEGYISVEQWTEIRAILADNGWSRDHANLGTGAALVQGLLRCGVHANRRMSTRYKHGHEGWRRSYGYRCCGDYVLGGSVCGLLPGARVDEAVTQAVLERRSRPTIAAVRTAFDQAVADARAEQRHRTIEKARLQQRVAALEDKLEALDPDSFHVFKSVERRLEEANRDLVALEAIDDAGRARTARADAAMLAEAEKLDVLQIWNAATTTDRDRKELIRMLVRSIVVEKLGRESPRLRIRWTDGSPDRSIDVWLQAGVERLMRELVAAGRTWEETASVLNGMGIKTRRGNPFTAGRVQQAMWRQSRKADRGHERVSRRHDPTGTTGSSA